MAGRHHRCNERRLGKTPGDGKGQGGLACCSLWGLKESDMTGRLNNNNKYELIQTSSPYELRTVDKDLESPLWIACVF